ncbi:hypothetical protein WJX73_004260 [Symbiochloris irregularis]|uniref:Cyclic nucleotide-binding domain-containing protein n=1 Tax=Symbiochloris irregularis TaxID=706552 RepID=A0AAW1P6E9_9CHLO
MDLRVVLGDPELTVPKERRLRRSTNSFRKKLFGQDRDENAEEIITQQSSNNVWIHPLSKFRDGWDTTTLILVVYTVLVLPFRAAFFFDYYKDLEHDHNLFLQLQADWMLSTDLLTDLFFMADILMNFNTGVIVDQVLIMDRKEVARHYCKTWLALDVVASFPLDLIFAGKRLDMWRLPRLLKIIRVMHYKSLTHALHSLGRVPLISEMSRFHGQLLRLLTFLTIWVHWNACFQYASCANPRHNRMCWVEAGGLLQAGIWEKYSWSVLKALSETVAAGYGIQNPATAADCWVTIISLLMGICIWTYLTSILTTLLIVLNASSSEYTSKMASLNQFMQHRKLPQDMRRRIRDTYEARWKAEKHFDEEEILEELPGSLRVQVCMHTCADVINSVPFFDDAEEGFIASLVTLLRPQVCLKDEYLFREGEVSREMFFLKSGAVQVEMRGTAVTILKRGSYFGEIGLLRGARRSACVKAISDTCDLFMLSKKAFDGLMEEYPDSFRAMDLAAEHRLRALRASWAWEQRDSTPAQPRAKGAALQQLLEMQHLERVSHPSSRRSSATGTLAEHGVWQPFQVAHAPAIPEEEDAEQDLLPQQQDRGRPGAAR